MKSVYCQVLCAPSTATLLLADAPTPPAPTPAPALEASLELDWDGGTWALSMPFVLEASAAWSDFTRRVCVGLCAATHLGGSTTGPAPTEKAGTEVDPEGGAAAGEGTRGEAAVPASNEGLNLRNTCCQRSLTPGSKPSVHEASAAAVAAEDAGVGWEDARQNGSKVEAAAGTEAVVAERTVAAAADASDSGTAVSSADVLAGNEVNFGETLGGEVAYAEVGIENTLGVEIADVDEDRKNADGGVD